MSLTDYILLEAAFTQTSLLLGHSVNVNENIYVGLEWQLMLAWRKVVAMLNADYKDH